MADSSSDQIHKTTTRRLGWLLWLTAAAAVFIAAQFFQLMVLERTEPRNSAPRTRTERGPILDRNGNILAMQTRLNTVTAWTPSVSAPEETAEILGDMLAIDSERLLMRFRTEPGFMFVKRTISPELSQRIEELQEQEKLAGIYLQEDFGRSYPEGELASHVLGYVGIDNRGLDGIEYEFDEELTAPPQEHQGDSFGHQVVLTIDSSIQAFTDDLSSRVREEHQAEAVILLVMDAYTGEMLAYSASPRYNPNFFTDYTPEQRRNLPVSYLYEPGSVFKIFTMASFLHLGAISLDDYFSTGGSYERYRDNELLFRISDLGNYGRINPADIIRLSSNVGAAYASDNVSDEQLYNMIRKFGFGEHTNIQLSGEERGILRPPESWSARTKPTISIGQEIAVSAMQILAAGSVFANDGVLLQPQIVRRLVSPEGQTVETAERTPVRQVISPASARAMLEMMVGATQSNGTARRARIEGIEVAAKTGTAQMLDPDTGTYSEDAFIPSTLAVFPAHNPQIIAYTALINPQAGEYLGGRIAAPIISELGEFLVPYLGIPRDSDTIYQESSGVRIQQTSLPPLEDTVPDYTGLPKRILMQLHREEDIEVLLRGSGWVVSQDPPPGTPLTPDTRIILELE